MSSAPSNGGDVLAAIILAARDAGISELALVALGQAESNLDPHAERWANRTAEAKRAIAAEDWGALQQIVDEIVASGSRDVSFGSFQIAVFWSGEFVSWDVADVLAFRAKSFDIHYQAPVAAARLKPYLEMEGWDGNPEGVPDEFLLGACFRWNWPAGGGEPKSEAVAATYARGLREAVALLWAEEEETMLTIEVPWIARWQAARPNAVYHADWGFEAWWREATAAHFEDPNNHQDPGYPLEDEEVTAEWDGVERWCRTFSQAGLVEWVDGGIRVTGWPAT